MSCNVLAIVDSIAGGKAMSEDIEEISERERGMREMADHLIQLAQTSDEETRMRDWANQLIEGRVDAPMRAPGSQSFGGTE
jgi:hypothetical protein